jgi:hypothetical protein
VLDDFYVSREVNSQVAEAAWLRIVVERFWQTLLVDREVIREGV